MSSLMALVVEDDEPLRKIYRRVLTEIGYEVLEADNGEMALELLSDHKPDILFLDMFLPRTSGLDVLKIIADEPSLQYMRVVIVSSNKKFEQYAVNFPLAHFVLKPIRPAVIRQLATSLSAM